jgi:hypothetical protein
MKHFDTGYDIYEQAFGSNPRSVYRAKYGLLGLLIGV